MVSELWNERKYFNRGFWFELLAFLIYVVALTTWNILFKDSTLAIFGELWKDRITQIEVKSVENFWQLLQGPVLGLLVCKIRLNNRQYLMHSRVFFGRFRTTSDS